MKLTLAVAALLGVAAAKEETVCNGRRAPYSPYDLATPNQDIYDVEHQDIDNEQAGVSESLASKGLAALRDNFLEHDNDGKIFSPVGDLAGRYLENDGLSHKILCVDHLTAADVGAHPAPRNDNLIDHNANRVDAKFESCHVGETIIPALREKTHVSQAASYNSDSAGAYVLKGTANNNYKLSGCLTKKEVDVSKGGANSEETLSLCGNKNKKYCQRGNRALLNCECGDGEGLDGFGLKTELLDSDANHVCADPAERVAEEVDAVIKQAVSQAVSKAVASCFKKAFDNTVNIY